MFHDRLKKEATVRVGSEGQCGGVCGAADLPTTVQLCSSPLCMTNVHYCMLCTFISRSEVSQEVSREKRNEGNK